MNKKYYIGKHQTNNLDDGYMGSGKILKYAIEKYGIESFTKEILHVFDNEEEMNAKEKELVVVSEETYNLCEGGKGGFSYINKQLLSVPIQKQNIDKEKRKRLSSIGLKRAWDSGKYQNVKFNESSPFKGKKHSEESKNKIGKTNSISQQGKNNSQYGTIWITNGLQNKKIKNNIDNVPDGWYRGRVIKK